MMDFSAALLLLKGYLNDGYTLQVSERDFYLIKSVLSGIFIETEVENEIACFENIKIWTDK